MANRAVDPEARLRKVCLSFPQTSERLSHSAPTWFYKEKKSFLMLLTVHFVSVASAISASLNVPIFDSGP